MPENQKYTHRKKIMQKCRIRKIVVYNNKINL